MNNQLRIEYRVDTRSRDVNFKPIPGTGDIQPCDCCGKLVEIHVYGRNGDELVMLGTSCAKKQLTVGSSQTRLLSADYTATPGSAGYKNAMKYRDRWHAKA